MRIQAARVTSLAKRAAVELRQEPRMIAYVRFPDGSLAVPRAGRFDPIEQTEIDQIDREGGLCIRLAYDAEAFGNLNGNAGSFDPCAVTN